MKPPQYDNNSSEVFGWHFAPLYDFLICSSKSELFIGLNDLLWTLQLNRPPPKLSRILAIAEAAIVSWCCYGLEFYWLPASSGLCAGERFHMGEFKEWKEREREIRQKKKPNLCW